MPISSRTTITAAAIPPASSPFCESKEAMENIYSGSKLTGDCADDSVSSLYPNVSTHLSSKFSQSFRHRVF